MAAEAGVDLASQRRHRLATIVVLAAAGAAAGACFSPATALLTAVGCGILGWAVVKAAIWAGVRGALLGAVFAVLVGPLADRMISGRPIRETFPAALCVGALLGGVLGIRHARPVRSPVT